MARYQSPLLSDASAAELADADASLIDASGVAWHYGNPLGEQRAFERGPAVVDRSHRAVLAVSGRDAATFLHNLLSQKLIDAPEGFAAAALDLDAQGRILHHCDLTVHGDTFYLDVPSYQRESFEDYLRKMVFWSQVSIEASDLAILTILGGDATVPQALARALGDRAVFTRSVKWSRAVPRVDVAVARGALREVVDTLAREGIPRAGLMAYTAERVKAGEPELRADLDGTSIPHEAPWLIGRGAHAGAVHLDKGCYRGQETVARVENLGRSPRLLVTVHLDGSAPVDPVPGSEITRAGRRVGRLGTVVHDADFGPIGLALLKRSALGAGELTVEAEVPVAAAVDPDSLPVDEGEKAGRRAVERLRKGE
ncbi:folate-binding protein YgfZ [Corynebacterium liangguodongii]|uniref:Folate-binding protein YgfZ n=1 Tax=Corynebacterium liangguodongii TaxID=2079535 RepID=A0A2S0WH81_9CORY|nr:folate-binding protein YgfZ [Corynebacterium liangguodongii]PWB99762.1 folate-binding protein [Corynebacterium liangguodongii]